MTKLTNKKSRIIALLLFIVLSSTCTIFVLGCGEKSDAVEGILTETVRPVKVIKAEVTAKPEKLMISGRVTHKRQAMLAFRVGGFIDRITVEVGDAFKKGDLLAQLDTTEVAATFRDVVAQRKQLERDSERLKNLYDHDVVTLQQLQEVETALERTKAGEQRARFTLERTKILAPFDGFVAMKLADEGEMHGEGAPVLRVVDANDARRVRVGVPSRYLSWVKVGQVANVYVDALDDPLEARIVEIGAVAELQTGNVQIELELPLHKTLFEGVIVGVELYGPIKDVIALPGGALAEGDQDRAFVYVIEEDHALRREVTIVEINHDVIYVMPTLKNGTLIVCEAAGYLRDGEAVKIDKEIDL